MGVKFVFVITVLLVCDSFPKLTSNSEPTVEKQIAKFVADVIRVTYSNTHLPIFMITPGTFYPPSHRNSKYGDELIQMAQDNGHILIGNEKYRPMKLSNNLVAESYVILIPPIKSQSDFQYIVQMFHIILDFGYNPLGKMIFVCSVESEIRLENLPLPQFLLNFALKFDFVNSIVIEPKFKANSTFSEYSKNFTIYNWKINEQNNICTGKLDNIRYFHSDLSKVDMLADVFLQEKLNFKNCALKLSISKSFPFDYIINDILYIVSQQINVKFLVSDDIWNAHVSFPGYYGTNDRGMVHSYTYPYFRHDLTWWVPSGQGIPRWLSFIRAFSPKLWFLILLTFAFGTCTIWLLQKSPMTDNIPKNGHIMVLLSTLFTHLGIGFADRYKGPAATLFFTLWLYYCLIINTVYQSQFFGFLVYPGNFPPITTLQELEESGLVMERGIKIIGDEISQWYFRKYNICKHSLYSCLQKVAYDRTHAVLTDIESIMYQIASFQDIFSNPLIVPLHEVVGSLLFSIQIHKLQGVLKNVFDSLLHNLVSTGLVGSEVMWLRGRFQANDDSPHVFSLVHLQSSFYLLLIGLSLAFFLYITEILVHFIGNAFFLYLAKNYIH
ncbi:Ionotropic receptor 298 [Blattella germanica]|nr:Ionotropic receptor 298 [Blattella germanica]